MVPHMRTTSHIRAVALVAVLAALTLAGCSQQAAPARVHRMGERVTVGPLTYNVLDAQWKTDLSDEAGTRSPKNRFLLIQLTVTNGGGTETFIPSLNLEDAQGKAWPEETGGQGVANWLGMLRKIAPAQTESGRILFDVPNGAYRLRATDDNPDPSQEKAAFIEIPFRMEPEPLPKIMKELPETEPPAKR